MSLFFSSKSYLGIDIGSSGIKIVELKGESGKVRLMTYGFAESLSNLGQKNTKEIAKIISQICQKSDMTSRSAVSALPTFSVFSSIINLSGVGKKDIAQAVQWEAKKVIPLPLEDMIIDWKKVDNPGGSSDKNNTKILLTGAPRQLVKKYIEIFKLAQINLLCLETETFAIVRSLLGADKSTVMLLEIGSTTTDISIVEQSLPILNRSIDIGGLTITKAISGNLNIGMERAEQFKYDLGVSLSGPTENIVPKTISEVISPIVNEVKYTLNLFQGKNNRTVEKIILSGGSALLPNLANYLTKILNLKVIIGDPWARVSYPLELKPLLEEIGPRLTVAVGLAMREVE